MDNASRYIVNWRSDDGVSGEARTSWESCTVRELTPNTKYSLTVIACNICGRGTRSNFSLVATIGMTTLVTPLFSSIATTTSSTNVYNSSTITAPAGTVRVESLGVLVINTE